MKLTIKLPVGINRKFKLQSRGNIPGKQYKTAAGVLEGVSSVFLCTGLKEKTSIAVKEYIHSSFENINESLPSFNKEYLLYISSCFLEDFLSDKVLVKTEKRWTNWVRSGGNQK